MRDLRGLTHYGPLKETPYCTRCCSESRLGVLLGMQCFHPHNNPLGPLARSMHAKEEYMTPARML